MIENNSLLSSFFILVDEYFSSLELEIDDIMTFQDNFNLLISLIRKNYHKGLSPATSTNFSLKLPIKSISKKENTQNFFIMTRSGIDKEFCNEKDLIVNDKGEILLRQEVNHKPSAEAPLHLAIYHFFPKVTCILHSHSVISTVLSKFYLKDENLTFEGYEIQKGIKGIETHDSKILLPIVENTQDMLGLALKMPSILNKTNTYGLLLAGHGLYVWGDSFEEAKRHLETYEFLLQATYMSNLFTLNLNI